MSVRTRNEYKFVSNGFGFMYGITIFDEDLNPWPNKHGFEKFTHQNGITFRMNSDMQTMIALDIECISLEDHRNMFETKWLDINRGFSIHPFRVHGLKLENPFEFDKDFVLGIVEFHKDNVIMFDGFEIIANEIKLVKYPTDMYSEFNLVLRITKDTDNLIKANKIISAKLIGE